MQSRWTKGLGIHILKPPQTGNVAATEAMPFDCRHLSPHTQCDDHPKILPLDCMPEAIPLSAYTFRAGQRHGRLMRHQDW